MMIGLEDGKIELYDYSDGDKFSELFEPTPTAALALLKRVEELAPSHVNMSSSVDFPEEAGFSDEFCIDEWIESGRTVLRDARIVLQGGFDI